MNFCFHFVLKNLIYSQYPRIYRRTALYMNAKVINVIQSFGDDIQHYEQTEFVLLTLTLKALLSKSPVEQTTTEKLDYCHKTDRPSQKSLCAT